MSSPSTQLPVGQVIGGRYRIQSVIGRGGMGLVYAAVHELTGRRVALKLMLSECGESPLLQERFLSEARIAAAVRHPNIVDVLDMGIHEGAPFLVMELLEGISLERLLEAQTRLSPEQALSWLLPIVGALAVLHDAGIVHRDIKPSNIFLSSLPRHPVRPKLLDFGLARVMSDLRLTRSGNVIGTPLYMAPEHAAGHVTGPQADVWSIGVVLYECLTGESPFDYTDRSSLAAQVLAGLVRPLSQLRPDLPEPLSSAVSRALQRDLGRRYRDMRAFARALHASARASHVSLPSDPDPIGLPEYTRWQTGGGEATTMDHSGYYLPQGSTEPSLSRPGSITERSQDAPTYGNWAPGALLVALLALTTLVYAVSSWQATAARTPAATAPAVLPSPRPVLRPLERPTVESLAPHTRFAPGEVRAQADAGVKDASVTGAASLPGRTRRAPGERGSTRRAGLGDAPLPRSAPEELPSASPSNHADEIEAEWK